VFDHSATSFVHKQKYIAAFQKLFEVYIWQKSLECYIFSSAGQTNYGNMYKSTGAIELYYCVII
jgi:hypothetical protein